MAMRITVVGFLTLAAVVIAVGLFIAHLNGKNWSASSTN
jgi:hypothetical protein